MDMQSFETVCFQQCPTTHASFTNSTRHMHMMIYLRPNLFTGQCTRFVHEFWFLVSQCTTVFLCILSLGLVIEEHVNQDSYCTVSEVTFLSVSGQS